MEIVFRLFALKILPVLHALEHVLGLILLWTAIIIAFLLFIEWFTNRNKKKAKYIKVEAPPQPIVKNEAPALEPVKEIEPEVSVKEEVISKTPVLPKEPSAQVVEKEKEEWFSLQDDINNLSSEFRKNCAQKNISFALELDDRLPQKIYANKQRLNELIEQLFSIAFEQTNAGNISLKIKMVKANDKTGTAQLLVTDTGAGLPTSLFKAVQEKDLLFKFEDTFLQSVLTKLRQVKQSIENQGGRLTLATKAGQGSTIGALVEFGV